MIDCVWPIIWRSHITLFCHVCLYLYLDSSTSEFCYSWWWVWKNQGGLWVLWSLWQESPQPSVCVPYRLQEGKLSVQSMWVRYILKTSNKCFVLMFRIFIPRAIIICFLFQSLKMGRKLTSCIKMKYQNNNNEKFFHHTVLTPFVLINPFCI